LSPLPDLRTPLDRARELEPRCKGLSEESAAAIVSAGGVDSVEPAYSYVSSGPSDREARLRGARIHVRPLPGFSRESIQRGLECHQKRVVLNEARALDNDPYVLPGRWLDIDVDSEGDGFVVSVTIDSFGDARSVLDRARWFAHESTKLR
jgi:hypothetical protein